MSWGWVEGNVAIYTFMSMQGCHSQGKSLENEIFCRSGKSQVIWKIAKSAESQGKSQGISNFSHK